MSIPPEYFDMSDDELYLALANIVSGGNSSPADKSHLEVIGYTYFNRNLPAIRALVCGSPALPSFLNKDDVYLMSAAICELIAEHFGAPKASATLAVLAARMGLKKLCPAVST